MLRHNIKPDFIVSLGNCGTSDKTFFGTLDDCIVISTAPRVRTNRKVSLKFLKNDTRDVEVRFFSDMKTNVYEYKKKLSNDPEKCKDAYKYASLISIVNYLTNDQKLDETTNRDLIIKLSESLQNFFNRYTKLGEWNERLSSYIIPTTTLQPESSNVVVSPSYNVGDTNTYVTLFNTADGNAYYKKGHNGKVDYKTIYKYPPVGGNHKIYRTSRKYQKHQSRKKSRRHFQRRKKTHRRKSRTSRRSRK